MKRFSVFNFWMYLVLSALMIIAGILMLVFPAFSVVLLFKIVGIMFEIGGVISIIMFFVRKSTDSGAFDLFSGCVSIVLGIPLIIATESAVGGVTLIAGILIAIFSIVMLFISLLIRRVTNYWIPMFIISLLSLGGSFVVVTNMASSLGVLFGIALIVTGLLTGTLLIFIRSRVRQMKKTFENVETNMNNEYNDNNEEDSDVIETTINE